MESHHCGEHGVFFIKTNTGFAAQLFRNTLLFKGIFTGPPVEPNQIFCYVTENTFKVSPEELLPSKMESICVPG